MLACAHALRQASAIRRERATVHGELAHMANWHMAKQHHIKVASLIAALASNFSMPDCRNNQQG